MNRILIAALKRVIADGKRQVLRNLLEDIGTNYYTKEYFLSKEADDEWQYLQEENDIKDREEWATDEAQFYLDNGYPNQSYYTKPKQVKDGTWLVHFTDSEPNDIVKKGFKGRDFDILGLTTQFTVESNPGDYAFAYTADKVDDFDKYGINAVFFKAKEAVETFHHGNEEDQVLFVAETAYDLKPVWGNSDDEFVMKQENGEDFVCDRDQDCVEKLIEKFESK